jgi:hypothetical protein
MANYKISPWTTLAISAILLGSMLATARPHQRVSERRVTGLEIATPISDRSSLLAACLLMEPGRRQVVRPLSICQFGQATALPDYVPWR